MSFLVECIDVEVRASQKQDAEPLLRLDRFALEESEQAAVMGPSGSGKSTLLNLLSGLLLPAAGEVRLFGSELNRMSEPERDKLRGSRIGYVFQQFHLFPALTPVENILMQHLAHPRHPYAEAVRRARELLADMGLSHRTDARTSLLSRGEQQRAAIARAMFGEPKLLLADEPTGNLDAVTGQAVIDCLQSACRERGSALLVVTHDESVAARFPRMDRMQELNRIYAEQRGEAALA